MYNFDVFYPGMFRLFFECPMKYYFKYVEQISYPVLDKNFITGKNIHALASYYLKGENILKLEAGLNETERGFWEFLKNSEYYKYKILGVEKNILRRLDKYWIGGRLDALVCDENALYILDYKTGGVGSDMTYDFQTMCYCLLCDDFLKDFNDLNFVYIDLKNKKNVQIKYNDALKHEYQERVLRVCNEIAGFNKDNFVKPDCTCEYNSICK